MIFFLVTALTWYRLCVEFWPTGLGHTSASRVTWYTDQVRCVLTFVAVSRSHVTWLPRKPDIRTAWPTHVEYQGGRPSRFPPAPAELDLSPGTWSAFFRGRYFEGRRACLGYSLASGSHVCATLWYGWIPNRSELTWYSPRTTHKINLYDLEHSLGIYGFRPTWLCLIVELLATAAKFLQPSSYYNGINCAFTFQRRSD